MRYRQMFLWIVGEFASTVVSRTMYVNDLLVIRVAIPVATAALVSAYSQNALSAPKWIIFEIAIIIANFLGRISGGINVAPGTVLYALGEPLIANLIFLGLIWYWHRYPTRGYLTRPTVSNGAPAETVSNNASIPRHQSLVKPARPKLILDDPWVVIFFIVISIFLCGIVGIVGEIIIVSFTMSNFSDFWTTESIGTIVTLPALLFLAQINWSWIALCSWRKAVAAAILTALIIVIPIGVNFIFETPKYIQYPPIYKIFWAVLITIPILSVSGALLGVTGLACHIVLSALVTPMVRFLPGNYDYGDHTLNIILLIVDIAMLPYLVLLADMARLLNSVELQVRERTAELEKANQEKTEFMSFLCHELRNPLHVVASLTDMALADDLDSSYAKAVSTAAKYMTDLCNDVLDATKLKSGKTNLKPGWCDLSALLQAQCDTFALHAVNLGITLQFHPDNSDNMPKQVFVDNLRWRQCLTNLLTNACRFTKAGGRVDVYLFFVKDAFLPSDQCRVRCEVTDTGIGIDATHIPTLFIPFSIASQETTREYQGSGLGLSLSAMLVELMGGKLQVASVLGEGSRFWFELVVPKDIPLCEVVTDGIIFEVQGKMSEIKDGSQSSVRGAMIAWGDSLQDTDMETLMPTGEEAISERIEMIVNSHLPAPTKKSNASTTVGEIIGRRPTIKNVERAGSPVSASYAEYDSLRPDTGIDPKVMSNGMDSLHPIADDGVPVILANGESCNAGSINGESPYASTEPEDSIVCALVVDDSDVNRSLLKRMLGRIDKNMCVDVAVDGVEAIEACQHRQYQIIFMDLHMPRVDGWEATRSIRQKGLNMQTPIIITSANTAQVGQDHEEVGLGLLGALPKPFLLKDLKAILEQYPVIEVPT